MHRNPREAAVPIRDWLGNDLYRVPAGLWRRKQIANSDPLATVGRRIDFACHRHEVQRRAHWRQRRQLWGYSGGSNRLIGNEGNDLLIAAPGGSNYIDGGSGIDWLSSNFPAGTLGGLTINLTLQGKAQNTGQGMWTILNIENVSGSTGDDLITGDAGSNYLVGSAGSDRLYGGAGNDTLLGDGEINFGTAIGSGAATVYLAYVGTLGTEQRPDRRRAGRAACDCLARQINLDSGKTTGKLMHNLTKSFHG